MQVGETRERETLVSAGQPMTEDEEPNHQRHHRLLLRVRDPAPGVGQEPQGGSGVPSDPAGGPGVHYWVGFHLREGLPVHGHGGQLRLHQNERRGLHGGERSRESLGCGRLRLPSAGRLFFRGDDKLHHNRRSEYGKMSRGQMTGVCVNTTKTCEVLAWCPVENDHNIPDPPLLMSAENYTLFIKNSVTFPLFGVARSNLVEGIDAAYISKCLHDPKDAPLCPIFRLGDIVKESGFNFETIAQVGGAIGIVVDWTCNFDVDVKHCKPKYNFHGLYGNPAETDKARASVGYNFRYAKHYFDDNVQKRTLLKVFGIRFDIIVQSLARKFDIIPTLTAIGSGVGIFGVATVVCDLMMLYLLPKREFYKNMKFKHTDTHQQHDSESLRLDTSVYYTLEANARQVQGTDQSNDPDSEAGSIETDGSKK
uniref:P2X purinoceptor n=1 Tax=Scophthalmus maximus TaxID=52904 RepID=A0A8D2ZEB5_SCOMX